MENRFVVLVTNIDEDNIVASYSELKFAVTRACQYLNEIVAWNSTANAETLVKMYDNRVHILDLETNKLIVNLMWFSDNDLVLAGWVGYLPDGWDNIPHIWRDDLVDESPVFWSFKEFDGTGDGAMKEPEATGTLVELNGTVYQNISAVKEESVWQNVQNDDDTMTWAGILSKGDPKVIWEPS